METKNLKDFQEILNQIKYFENTSQIKSVENLKNIFINDIIIKVWFKNPENYNFKVLDSWNIEFNWFEVDFETFILIWNHRIREDVFLEYIYFLQKRYSKKWLFFKDFLEKRIKQNFDIYLFYKVCFKYEVQKEKRLRIEKQNQEFQRTWDRIWKSNAIYIYQ